MSEETLERPGQAQKCFLRRCNDQQLSCKTMPTQSIRSSHQGNGNGRNGVVNLVGKELCAGLHTLSHQRNVASLCLLYKYYYRRCSSELADLVPPKRVTVRSTRFSEQMHRHTLSLPKCRTGYYTSSFFPRTATIWNSLSNECFSTDYDLTAFKGRVNKFLLQ